MVRCASATGVRVTASQDHQAPSTTHPPQHVRRKTPPPAATGSASASQPAHVSASSKSTTAMIKRHCSPGSATSSCGSVRLPAITTRRQPSSVARCACPCANATPRHARTHTHTFTQSLLTRAARTLASGALPALNHTNTRHASSWCTSRHSHPLPLLPHTREQATYDSAMAADEPYVLRCDGRTSGNWITVHQTACGSTCILALAEVIVYVATNAPPAPPMPHTRLPSPPPPSPPPPLGCAE